MYKKKTGLLVANYSGSPCIILKSTCLIYIYISKLLHKVDPRTALAAPTGKSEEKKLLSTSSPRQNNGKHNHHKDSNYLYEEHKPNKLNKKIIESSLIIADFYQPIVLNC